MWEKHDIARFKSVTEMHSSQWINGLEKKKDGVCTILTSGC